MTRCQLCKHIVIGIEGNDVVIPSYLLRSSAGANLESVVGSVHSSCLRTSRYATEYSLAMKDYVESVLMPRSIESYVGGFAAQLSNTRDWIVVFDDAFSARISPKRLRKIKFDSLEAIIPWESEILVRVPLRESDKAFLAHGFSHNGIPLPKLLDLAGVSPGHCEHISVEDAILRPYSDDPDASFEALQDNVIGGHLTHDIRFPGHIGKLICPKSA